MVKDRVEEERRGREDGHDPVRHLRQVMIIHGERRWRVERSEEHKTYSGRLGKVRWITAEYHEVAVVDDQGKDWRFRRRLTRSNNTRRFKAHNGKVSSFALFFFLFFFLHLMKVPRCSDKKGGRKCQERAGDFPLKSLISAPLWLGCEKNHPFTATWKKKWYSQVSKRWQLTVIK